MTTVIVILLKAHCSVQKCIGIDSYNMVFVYYITIVFTIVL